MSHKMYLQIQVYQLILLVSMSLLLKTLHQTFHNWHLFQCDKQAFFFNEYYHVLKIKLYESNLIANKNFKCLIIMIICSVFRKNWCGQAVLYNYLLFYFLYLSLIEWLVLTNLFLKLKRFWTKFYKYISIKKVVKQENHQPTENDRCGQGTKMSTCMPHSTLKVG